MNNQQRNQRNRSTTHLPSTIVLWLGIIGATLLLLLLFLYANRLRQNVAELEREVVAAETAVSSQTDLVTPNVSQALANRNQQIAQIVTLESSLAAQDANWPVAAQAIQAYQPSQLMLQSITQQGNQLLIQGRGMNETAVQAYADQLEASGAFNQVAVQSLIAVQEPFVTPTPSPIPPTPTPSPTNQPTAVPTQTMIPPTPTADLRDEFEWDDQEAKPIFIDDPQTHNFLPYFDVDNVTFLAKAGRMYQIRTEFLAAGVDTFLTITFGEQTVTNDDAQLGTLASAVTLPAQPQDTQVFVRIANRGAYGADKAYDVVVEEIVPTAVPTQPTVTPHPTLTPTPDWRDSYEPDDVPTVLSVGESQIHNFYPSVDQDHLQLLTKAGRSYQIGTTLLAAGVDTVLTLEYDRIRYQNDDFSPPGFSDLTSSICFSAGKDDVALIDIQNKGGLFGQDKTYTVFAVERPFYVDKQHLDFGTITADAPLLSDTIQIQNGTNITWTAVTTATWLTATPNGQTLQINVDPAGLPEGDYRADVALEWEGICQQPIAVYFHVDPPEEVKQIRPFPFVAKPNPQIETAVEFVIVVELMR